MRPPVCSTSPRHGPLLVALACAALLARPASAQYREPLLPAGTRVRISGSATGEEQFVGRVRRLTSDSLVVGTESGHAVLQLRTSRLTSLEISEGHHRAIWALQGAVIGGIATGLIAAVVVARTSRTSNINPVDPFPLIVLIGGGLAGGAGGAVVGAVIAPERWRKASGLLR